MIEQVMIAICGTLSVHLSQDPRRAWSRWACIAGLLGEPFWLWSAWKASQWGVVVMVVVYTAGWLRGLYHNWVKQQ